ncbi:hypothetical protein [Aequorivita capsosiphonis]|uniref:hypothetical protein n=1 Tax=Aequorivita capsosiphonis TaxID=487317 RepID=UPI0012FCDBFC|nr:hypothetical protein [Aequorivita capsosiphonis]
MKRTLVWKTNSKNQLGLPPPNYDDSIPNKYPVCIVNMIIDEKIVRLLKRPIEAVVSLAIILAIY